MNEIHSSLEWLEDPEVFAVNRERAVSYTHLIVHLVSALADLMQQGHQVVLVSSGAVGSLSLIHI